MATNRRLKTTPEDLKYRVFLSYSHQDRKIARTIDQILKANGLAPMWDEHFAYGQGFHDQIKNYIAHAHVFLPVLTETASKRNWVHQEIGYAMALNVAVLPVAIGELPGEMIHHLHAIRVIQTKRDTAREELASSTQSRLKKLLTNETIARLIETNTDLRRSFYTCADFPEARASMMASYYEDVRALGGYGLVRQEGALSSFHIPLETINHTIWKDRYGGLGRRSEHCRLQRSERLALTRHATRAGCALIINPYLEFEEYGLWARRVRLQCLSNFLDQTTDDKCHVAIERNQDRSASNTYVGDWFAAESVRAVLGQGYYQTIFTRHAASLREKIANFDSKFDELLAGNGTTAWNSRRHALKVIKKEMALIKCGPPLEAARSGKRS